MKRSVAILGPTPSFIRWAIWQPCALRELDESSLPDTTFRQLRAIRELSEGYLQNRIVDGFCIHPDSASQNVESALGFSEEEIIGYFGTKSDIDHCCLKCPANSLADAGQWAGCYGWLATSDFSFASQRSRLSETFDLVAIIEEVILANHSLDEANTIFEMTNPAWYGLWNSSIPNQTQLVF